jgi:hypothetical protein
VTAQLLIAPSRARALSSRTVDAYAVGENAINQLEQGH